MDIGKQCSPKSIITEHGVLFRFEYKLKIQPNNPLDGNGLVQLITMGKYVWHKWVNYILHIQATKAQTSLRKQIVLSESWLLTHTKSGSKLLRVDKEKKLISSRFFLSHAIPTFFANFRIFIFVEHVGLDDIRAP